MGDGRFWSAQYQRRDGQPDRIEGLELYQCPTCYITPQSDWLIGMYHGSQFPTYGPNGAIPGPAIMFGADVAKWPAWWHDTIATISAACSEADAIQIRSK